MTAGTVTIEPHPSENSLSAAEILRQSFLLAAQAQQTGRFAEAEQLYRAILAAAPAHADALHGLGTLAHQFGRSDIAAELIGKAILQRSEPMFHNNLGIALCAQSKFMAALAAHYRALDLKPTYAEAYNALGNVQLKLGELDEAIASYGRALALRPAYADAYSNLGEALQEKGELAAAEDAYEQALRLAPDCAEAHNNLGNVFRAQGRYDEALSSFGRALACRPAYAEAHNNQGNVFSAQGKHREALASFESALTFKPEFPEALTGYGHVLQSLGKVEEAMDAWRRALAIDPDCFEANCFLGAECSNQYLPSETIAAFERALAVKPDYAEAHNNIGTALLIEGRPEEALPAYDRAIALLPLWAEAHSNRILATHYVDSLSVTDILAASRAFGVLFDQPDSTPRATGDLSPDRRLRIGYVSGDFILHPVGFFLAPALAAHDPKAVETFCYSNYPKTDEMTERLRRSSDHWREIHGLSNTEAFELIRRDGIDILVDLSGHTKDNRLSLFGLKPAPVQVEWLGYFGTTGMATMDYVLLDPVSAPPGAETGYSESVARLPGGRFCYKAPDYAPGLVDPPCVQRGFVTFGSFNNVAKLGPDVIRLWAEIQRATPDSRLLLKWMSLRDERPRRRLLEAFAEAGVPEDRIELRGPSTHVDMLAEYGDVDIALDPFPFGGGLTSCDALWMGVPIVTLPGERLASRQTLGFLKSMGMEDLVATSPQDYVARATALAADAGRLRELRWKLRPAMAASPLYDGPKFTAGLEDAYREMWRRHCAGEKPQSFDVARTSDAQVSRNSEVAAPPIRMATTVADAEGAIGVKQNHVLISCLFGRKFDKVHPAVKGRRCVFFSNNPSLRKEAESKGWEFRLVEKHKLTEDYRISSMQSKYIKFLQFVDDYSEFADVDKLTYFDHKFRVEESHIEWVLDRITDNKAVLIRATPIAKTRISDEIRDAMGQERYSYGMDKTLSWIESLKKECGVKEEVRIVNTGFIHYSNMHAIKPMLDKIYKTIWDLEQPECQIIWAALSQEFDDQIQKVPWNKLNPLWQAPVV